MTNVKTLLMSDNVTSANDDDDDNFSADRGNVYVLAAAFLACSIVAPMVVAVLVDPLLQ